MAKKAETKTKTIGELRKEGGLVGKKIVTFAGNEFVVIEATSTDYFVKVRCTKAQWHSRAFLKVGKVKSFGNDAVVTIKESS